MKPLKLFIGIPVYGAMDASFAQCLVDLHLDPPCNEFLVCKEVGDSLVARARNTITAKFLGTDATHLLWLDSDLVFSPEHVRRLIRADRDIVCGFYPKKTDARPTQWVCNALPGPPAPIEPNGLQEIRYGGTGFMLVKRRVFEKMIAAFPQIAFPEDGTAILQHDFWSVGVHEFPDGSRRYLSEDWYFCQRWRELGGKIFADTTFVVKHVGQAVYPLKHQEPDFTPA